MTIVEAIAIISLTVCVLGLGAMLAFIAIRSSAQVKNDGQWVGYYTQMMANSYTQGYRAGLIHTQQQPLTDIPASIPVPRRQDEPTPPIDDQPLTYGKN